MYIDVMIRIKNAIAAKKRSAKVRYTRMDYAVLNCLQRAGYLKKVEVKGRSLKKIVEVEFNPERPVEQVRFLSTPSLRRYGGYQDFKLVRGGYGSLIVSTPRGILTGQEARRQKVGGQLLFEVR